MVSTAQRKNGWTDLISVFAKIKMHTRESKVIKVSKFGLKFSHIRIGVKLKSLWFIPNYLNKMKKSHVLKLKQTLHTLMC